MQHEQRCACSSAGTYGTGRHNDSSRAIDLGEVDKLVGLSITIRIFTANDSATPRLLVERSVFVNSDIDSPIDVRCQADGVTDFGRSSEQRDFESRRGLDT